MVKLQVQTSSINFETEVSTQIVLVSSLRFSTIIQPALSYSCSSLA